MVLPFPEFHIFGIVHYDLLLIHIGLYILENINVSQLSLNCKL